MRYKDTGCVIGVTSGCFDCTHALHVHYLERCKRKCDILIVLVDTDDLLYRSKGKYPVIPESNRLYMIDSLKPVDYSCVMDKTSDLVEVMQLVASLCNPLSKKTMRGRVFKNANQIYDKPVLMVEGLELCVVPDVNLFPSTTALVKFIKEEYNKTPKTIIPVCLESREMSSK